MMSGGPGEIQLGESRAPRGTDFRGIVTSVRTYAGSVKLDFGRSAAALESLFGSLAGVDGRKIVVIASESFPTRPGGDVFAYLENVRNQILAGGGTARLRASARTATISAEASAFNTSETVIALGRIANAAGVAIYDSIPTPLRAPPPGTWSMSEWIRCSWASRRTPPWTACRFWRRQPEA